MKTPCSSAASITNWPLGAVTGWPLMVSSTVSSGSGINRLRGLREVGGTADADRGLDGTADVGLELRAEPHHRRGDRRHRRRAERADRRLARRPRDAGADVVADVEEHVDVARAPLPGDDPAEDLLEPRRSLAARRALAARLTREEAHDAMCGAHDVGVLVHHDDRARAEHGAGLAHRASFERQVEVLLEEPRSRRASGDEGLELLPVADAAAVHRPVDEVAERRDA